MKEVFFPKEIWGIITLFLGKNYWEKRNHLTHISNALDLKYSNYAYHSYWKWNYWREKHINSWYLTNIKLSKPCLPERLKGHITNPYIKSINPPLLNKSSQFLYNEHKDCVKIVFDYIK